MGGSFNIIPYIPYILAIILLIPVIINYSKLQRQKYIAVFASLYMISTILSSFAFYFISSGNVLAYAIGEVFISLIDLMAGLVLLINLHRTIYVRKIEALSFAPLPFFYLNYFIGMPNGIKPLAINIEFMAELITLILLGASMSIYLGALYIGYQIYHERKGGSFYWLLLSLTVILIFISQLGFFITEFSEEIFESTIVSFRSLTIRSMLTLLVSMLLNIQWWYYKNHVLPILEKVRA